MVGYCNQFNCFWSDRPSVFVRVSVSTFSRYLHSRFCCCLSVYHSPCAFFPPCLSCVWMTISECSTSLVIFPFGSSSAKTFHISFKLIWPLLVWPSTCYHQSSSHSFKIKMCWPAVVSYPRLFLLILLSSARTVFLALLNLLESRVSRAPPDQCMCVCTCDKPTLPRTKSYLLLPTCFPLFSSFCSFDHLSAFFFLSYHFALSILSLIASSFRISVSSSGWSTPWLADFLFFICGSFYSVFGLFSRWR